MSFINDKCNQTETSNEFDEIKKNDNKKLCTGNVENVIVINHNPNGSHYLPQSTQNNKNNANSSKRL